MNAYISVIVTSNLDITSGIILATSLESAQERICELYKDQPIFYLETAEIQDNVLIKLAQLAKEKGLI